MSEDMGLKVGIVGCGAIGTILAKELDKDKDFKLCCVYDKDLIKSIELRKKLKEKPKVAKDLEEMLCCSLIIEAASHEAVQQHGLQILVKCDLMIMSVGAFSDMGLFAKIKKKAEEKGRKLYIPSGAIAGLDAIKAANIRKIDKVTLTTRKPPKGLSGAPYVIKNDIWLHSMRKPTVIFEGSAKEAAEWFPKNINVSVALSLVGIGVEKTRVRIIADPFSDKNVHEIEVEGSFGKMKTRTENVPTPGNKKTSYLAALSAIATLRKINENVQIGT